MHRAVLVLALAATGSCRGPATPAPATGQAFGLYFLALQWAPHACCAHSGIEAGNEACAQLPGSYAATHLTLHGLWPSYSDDEGRGKPHAWPQFCGAFGHCEQTEDASCGPGVPVPPALAARAPAYSTDGGALATHEWSKHGSCTKLAPPDYFQAELAAIHSLPGDGTPEMLVAGHDLARADLQRAFGLPPESVALGCDKSCRLTQVGFCLGHDDGDHPGKPVPCPANIQSSDYDNGCTTHACERVTLQAAGECGAK